MYSPSYAAVLLFLSVPQLHLECCTRLRLVQLLESCSEILELVRQISPGDAFVGALESRRTGPLQCVCRLAIAHGQAEGALHRVLPLHLTCGRAVVAPHMISGKILDVLPVEAQELD